MNAVLPVLTHFVRHPFNAIWTWLKGFARWFWHGVVLGAVYIRDGIRNHWSWIRKTLIVAVAAFFVAALIFSGIMYYIDSQIAPVSAPDQIVYLDQGWGTAANSDDRLAYYYLPQGAFVKNIRYDWIVNLERPWSRDRFATARYMRAYGFIFDPSEVKENPGKLPIGFAPRYDPNFNEMMLDLTCSACHTGELNVVNKGVRTSVRIDGGSGHHDFTMMKPGRFAADLSASMIATLLNPFKFLRFSGNVLKERDTFANRAVLWGELASVMWVNGKQTLYENWHGIYPVQEGFGRTEGLGRILNTTFAVNLDYKNYRVANAPVSYPFVWEIPWFDWVQYMGSVRQPFARNVGEAMGTGARYYLKDPFGHPLPASERFDASVKVANLDHIEHLIRKLRAPCWPDQKIFPPTSANPDGGVFPPIDEALAAEGKELFYNKFHCVSCHGPHVAPDMVTAADAPLKLDARNPDRDPSHPRNYPHWMVKALPLTEVGTDPTSALNFVGYKLDLTPTGMTADEVRKELTPYYETNYCRQFEYSENLVALTAADGNKYWSYPPREFNRPLSEEEGLKLSQQRSDFALGACHIPPPKQRRNGCLLTKAPVELQDLTPDQRAQFSPALTDENSCNGLRHLVQIGVQGYVDENLGNIDLSSVDLGHGLNYLITLVRKRSYQDLGIDSKGRETEQELMDGFAQLDTPQAYLQYKARPLAGIWATPPFLHNGSVPTLYDLLSPAYTRPKKFYLKGADYDTRAVGFHADSQEKGAFLFDTSLPGNSNNGHEFRAGYRPYKAGNPPANGIIGPEMTEHERWAIIEYLKIRRDTDQDPNAGPDPVCPETKYLKTDDQGRNLGAPWVQDKDGKWAPPAPTGKKP